MKNGTKFTLEKKIEAFESFQHTFHTQVQIESKNLQAQCSMNLKCKKKHVN